MQNSLGLFPGRGPPSQPLSHTFCQWREIAFPSSITHWFTKPSPSLWVKMGLNYNSHKKRPWNLDNSTIWAMAELCDKGFSLQGQLLVVFFFFNSMFYHCKSKIRMFWKTWEVVKSFKLIFQNFFIKIPQLLSFCCISAHNFCIKYSLYLSSLVWGLNTILSAFYYITKKIFWLTSW